MLPNYASWMGGREPGSVGECEVEFARRRVLFMFWKVSEMAVEEYGCENIYYIFSLFYLDYKWMNDIAQVTPELRSIPPCSSAFATDVERNT